MLTKGLQRPVGSYLVHRISVTGHDSRFDGIRDNPSAFTGLWIGQALWITCNLLPVMALNAVPGAAWGAAVLRGWTVTDVVGFGLFAGGFALEIAADRQKSAWLKGKREKTHDEQFLTKGLFGVW